jgi:hypothetical protein
MKIYVFEQWEGGEWRPKFIWRFASFAGALKVLNSEYRSALVLRIKRIKTPGELDRLWTLGVHLYNERNVLSDLWKVEWVT